MQYGFVAEKDTRDAIASFKIIIQRSFNMGQDVIMRFIDHEKVFHRIRHPALIQILQKHNIDNKDLQKIKKKKKEYIGNRLRT